MQRSVVLDRVATPDGRTLALVRRGESFAIRLDNLELMGSRASGSETALATLACATLDGRTAARVLVGGLGMGFTLRAVLDATTRVREARVVVVELFPAVVRWNRGWLAELAGRPLDDPRVAVLEGDVAEALATSPAAFDVVLLDVDNGPAALTVAANRGLYGAAGVTRIREALGSGGVVAVWSAREDPAFAARLRRGGFTVEVHRLRAGPGRRGARHVVFVGRKR